MKATNKVDRKVICAIKFKDLPFPEIDKYVCVPFSWIIHQLDKQTVLVAYPKNEAPFVTRNRTKKRETCNSEWRFYMGFIKYESEIYEDVVKWIEEMIAKGDDDQEEKPVIKDLTPKLVGNRQLRSSKNLPWSGKLPEKPQFTVKPYDNPRRPLPKILIRRPLPLRPWKPKRIELNKPAEPAGSSANTVPSQNLSVIEELESIDTSAQSRPKLPDDRQPSPKLSVERQPSPNGQDEQPLSMPDINDSDVEIEIEVQSEPIEEERPPSKTQTLEQTSQPHRVNERPASVTLHDYSLLESRLYEIHTGKPKEDNDTQKPSLPHNSTVSTKVKPPSRPNELSQHDYVQPSPVSTPCLKAQLQGTVETSSEVTHSYQNSHLQSLEKTVASTTYYKSNPIDLSSQRQIPAIRRKSSSAIKKLAEKKIHVENIAKNIPTSQQSLYNKQLLNYAGNVGDVIDHSRPFQNMNTFAAQNLSHLAHQSRFCVEPSQVQYLWQIARMQEMINRPNIPYIDQRSYLQNARTGGYVSQNQTSQINHPSQFFPQRQNEYPSVNTNSMHEPMRHELLNGSIDKACGALAAQSIQYTAQNQLAGNSENTRSQDLLRYQNPHTVKPLEFQGNSENSKLQVTEKRPLTPPKTNQQLSDYQKNCSSKDLLVKLSRGPIKYLEICGAAPDTIQDSETQTTSSESQESQFKQVPEKNVYQHPESKKLVVDQATEMESIIDDLHDDRTVASPPEPMDSGYETDKHSTNEQESPQEVPDSEMVSADEELLASISENDSHYVNEDDCSEADIFSLSITKKRSIDVQNLIPETQQKLSRMAEQEMLEVHGLLLTKMYKNFINTEGFFTKLRDATLECIELYETLLNKVSKVNVIESRPIPSFNTREIPQMAQEKPVAKSEQISANGERNNNSNVNNAPKMNRQRHKFVLPPEYDPNDSRWTLKHRKPGPGLIELMPQSRVYVNKAEYKKCIRSSHDCRTLARLLLTVVFSKNALSVCSPTGGRARAFKAEDIDVRPGLDENARMVLLAFIEEYGNKRNWNTSDTAGIMSSIRTKIQEMRNKYGKKRLV